MSKQVLLSADDVTYYRLPGSQGDLAREAAQAEDTTFGESFRSNFPAIIGWSLNANAVYKGFAGYQTAIKKVGTSVVANGEACTLLSGKTYQIDATTKRIWDRTFATKVYVTGVDHTTDVESIDFLWGKVTFKSTYVVTGAVTVDVKYFPVSAVGSARAFTLTQTADAIDTTTFAVAQANSGYRTHLPGLRTVNCELPGVYASANGLAALLDSRAEVILEINPDGQGKSVARGFFRMVNQRQQGNVGALEEENVTFALSSPTASSGPEIATPFSWYHDPASPIPAGLKIALEAWQNEDMVYAKYLHDGTNGYKGEGVITNVTLNSTMEGVNNFTCNIQGSGSLTAVP